MAPTIEDLIHRNDAGVDNHEPLATFQESVAANIEPPRIAIISCADPRITPERFFHLGPMDAVVFRNVGGHPQSCWKDIATLDIFLNEAFKTGGFDQLIIVHHTDCGTTAFTNEMIQQALEKQYPEINVNELAGTDFGAVYNSIEESVRDDLKWLKTAPLLRKELVEGARGFVFDIGTGKLQEV